MNKNAERLVEVIKEIDKLHIENPTRGELHGKITEILCEDKEQTLEMVKEVKNPKIFSHISSNFGYVYVKYLDLTLFYELEKAVDSFKGLSFDYPYYEWFKEQLESDRALVEWHEEDKKKAQDYDNLMTIFKNSSEEERYKIIINTTKEEDIEYYLNLSYDYTNDCIYSEFDFALCGEAFVYLVHKYPDAYFSNDRSNLIDIINLIDKSNRKQFLYMRDEALQLMRNSTDTGIISYINSTKQEEYFKLMGIFSVDSFNAIIPRSKEVKEALAKLIERCEGSFLQYYFRQFVDKL